ncbi:MAG: hypothetical protein HY298_15445 [Verrucomicrobia bacterium]|nr:hypothetical protein [Verrucomicrobiota bacterium]
MKSIALLSSLFMLVGLAWGQVYFSNNVTRAEAVRVASHLKIGMWEEDAAKLLATNGLKHAIGVGAKTGWNRDYGLSDGCSLVLDYRARDLRPNGWGGNGALQKAFIRSNGVTIVSITLTNAP